jgi:dimethylargininase
MTSPRPGAVSYPLDVQTIQDQTSALRKVYVRPPRPADLSSWSDFGWRAAPDVARADEEHAAFRSELEDAGAEVLCGSAQVPGDPDAIYAYDPVLMADDGAILLRPGKLGRRREPEACASDLRAAGVSILGTLRAPACAEGGDMFWLDNRDAARGPRLSHER